MKQIFRKSEKGIKHQRTNKTMVNVINVYLKNAHLTAYRFSAANPNVKLLFITRTSLSFVELDV